MSLRIILLIIFTSFKIALLQKASSSELTVSTIQRSSNIHKQLEERLSQIEAKIKDHGKLDILENVESKLDQTDQQLRAIKQQILQIQKTLANHRPQSKFPKHCKELKERGHNVTGSYTIFPEFAPEPFLVVCDMDSRDGGWTYILNRFNGNQDFFLDWNDYRNGFGNLADEFWLGLQNLYYLTGYEANELLIELEDWDSKEVVAHYGLFSIGSESEGYSLKLLGEYSGNAGDSLSYHAGMKFTTKDRDQDRYNGGNCASYRTGAWWYKNCVNSHLTGKYMRGAVTSKDEYKGMYWEKFHGPLYSLKEVRMMVRPQNGHTFAPSEENNSSSSEENGTS